jgi:hypothetical protein
MKLHEVLSFAADDQFGTIRRILLDAPTDYFDTTKQLVSHVNGEFKKAKIPFRLSTDIDDPDAPPKWANVGIYGGEYNPNHLMPYVIVLPSFLKHLSEHPDDVLRVLYTMYVHERVHGEQQKRAQATGRDPNVFATQGDTYEDYLSNPHEIAAFAAELIADLHSRGMSNNQITQAVLTNDTAVLSKTDTYKEYSRFTTNDRAKRRLLKTITTMLS